MKVNSAVNISEMLSLALHSMVLIANNGGEVVSVKDIARETGYSINHLAKVMQRLVKAGLLQSLRGPKGGFLLKRNAADISFLDIYEAIEGKIDLESCPVGQIKCPFSKCIFDGKIKTLNKQFLQFLTSKTLDSFLDYQRTV
ncbi:MAG: Rrf2 family transcriptional regulator [Bacillota bacterium]|nr:Rrf2 family transcriptional regulator [Bacillota bacterium]